LQEFLAANTNTYCRYHTTLLWRIHLWEPTVELRAEFAKMRVTVRN